MIKADKYYIENLNEILLQNNIDENPRPSYKDGTNVTKGTNFYDIKIEDFEFETSKDIKKIESELEIAI